MSMSTNDKINNLRAEALAHGDALMAKVCDEALCGNVESIAACLEVIADTNAQCDDLSEPDDDAMWDWAQSA